MSESQVGRVKPKPPSKIAIKRASINLESGKVDEARELEVTLPSPAPEIIVSPEPKQKKDKKKLKKKLGKSKSVEEESSHSVQILPSDGTSDVVLRSKSLANSKKAKVRRSSSYMFPAFRNRSKTSDNKNGDGSRLPNRAVSSCKGVNVKDKSSSIDRLKSRLSGSRASSLKRKQSLRSSNCSIDSASSQLSLNSSFTSLYNKDSSNTDLRHLSVTVNPPYHDPLFDSTNLELADALGRPPPPPPRYCPGAPNSSKQSTSSKNLKSEMDDEIESEYADLGDIAPAESRPKKPTSLRLKSQTEEVNSVYEEIDFISPVPEPNKNKRCSLPAATKFPPTQSPVEARQLRPSGIQPPKASSPIKRRGAQVRRQSRQKSFDHSLTIESEYCSLGEIRRPNSLELEKGVTEEDIKEEIGRVNSLRQKDADTPRPAVPSSSRDHGNRESRDTEPRDCEDKVDSIYCELGDVFHMEDPTPTADQAETEEKIDISRYRKDSQSSAYDLSESDDSDKEKEEPIYTVVRKDRITSQSKQSTSNSLKFVEVDGGFGLNFEEDEEETFEVDPNSEGEMYYPTSDSTSSCGSPIKRGLVVDHLSVEGRKCLVFAASFAFGLFLRFYKTFGTVEDHLFGLKVNHFMLL